MHKNLMLLFLLVVGAAMVLQIFTFFIQYRGIQKQFLAIKKRNPIVAVGKGRRHGLNKTAVLAFNSEGILQEAHILSGVTIFARLKPVVGMNGKHYLDIKETYKNNKRMNCITQAIQHMEGR